MVDINSSPIQKYTHLQQLRMMDLVLWENIKRLDPFVTRNEITYGDTIEKPISVALTPGMFLMLRGTNPIRVPIVNRNLKRMLTYFREYGIKDKIAFVVKSMCLVNPKDLHPARIRSDRITKHRWSHIYVDEILVENISTGMIIKGLIVNAINSRSSLNPDRLPSMPLCLDALTGKSVRD